MTYKLISSITVGSGGAATATFSSIPQTYTDLYIVFSPHNTRSNYISSDMALGINGSTASVTQRCVFSSSSGVNSSAGIQALFQGGYDSLVANQNLVFGPTSIYFPNYTSSNFKSMSVDFTAEGATTDKDQARNGFTALLWSNTAAITSITIESTSHTFVQHSTFYLYGINNS
jgi:hypothetical protein